MAVPPVIQELIKTVVTFIHMGESDALFAYDYAPPKDDHAYHRVQLYPAPVEVVGGARDGERTHPGFEVEVHEILRLFVPVFSIGFMARSPDEHGDVPANPYLLIVGHVYGSPVVLSIHQFPPVDAPAGLYVDPIGNPIRRGEP
jgi:hypothetical protein